VRRTTGQPRLSVIVQAWRLSLFGHIARMPDETYARSIISASPSEDWRKPPGRPWTTWMKTIQQNLRSNNLSLDEAITGSESSILETDVCVWRYAPLVVHATQEEEEDHLRSAGGHAWSACFVITRPGVLISPTATVYQCNISVPSLGSVKEYQWKLGSKPAYHTML